MLRSVRSRVVALTIGITIVSVAVTAFLVSRSVESAVRSDTAQSLEDDTNIFRTLVEYGAGNPTWTGVDATVRSLAASTGRRIALTERSGKLITDSDLLQGKRRRPLPLKPTAEIDPYSESLGGIYLSSLQEEPQPATADEISLNTERLAMARSCLDAAGVAYDVEEDGTGLQFVYQTDELDDVQQAAFDDCTNVFYLPTPDELAAMRAENQAVVACVRAAGFDATVVDDDYGGYVDTGDDADAGAMVSSCAEQRQRAELAPIALLYLGTRADASLTLERLGLGRSIAIVIAVLGAAILAAFVMGRLITRPLARLAHAATTLGGGRLDARVETSDRGEVGRVAAAFNTMAETLERTEASRRQMVSDIAHELRNPLVTINGTLEAIQDGVYQPSPSVIDSLAEETDHLRRLVGDLQELAAADAGALRLAHEPLDLADVVATVADAHRPLAAAADVDLVLTTSGPVEVLGDPVRLRQIVANLLSNALRYTPAGGRASVEVHAVGPFAELIVSDTGTGIAAEHLDSVFERFWRADPARARATGGSGLGLAITRELVRAHGGEITVTSAIDQGSTFTVRLPLAGLD